MELNLKAKLVLENGLLFEGEGFGATGESIGEIVFNTSLSGYLEILTDSSYCGQMVVMTYPIIGNYGISFEDYDTERPYLNGLLVKEYFDTYSNWRANESLSDYLKKQNIIGVQGIDTRMLTRVIRDKGSMKSIISTLDMDDNSLKNKILNFKEIDLVEKVTAKNQHSWSKDSKGSLKSFDEFTAGNLYNVVVYDFGVKISFLKKLFDCKCNLIVVPANTTSEDVLALKPDGIFLSNGPGNPVSVKYAIENIKKIISKKPIFGVSLGHQILSLALGGKTYKLKFGHRGGNQPVKNLIDNSIEITTQNHGFAVDFNSLKNDVELTHINLNDQTAEGIKHKSLPVFGVQYYPETSSGSRNNDYLFDDFIELMKQHK
jgi:carbamoyl-phosphate synthase small subunit